MNHQLEKIIETANQLKQNNASYASTGEQIAAAFVLNGQEYLPADCPDIIEAWDRLDDQWQEYVRIVKRDYMHRIKGE